ncbi:hypothetical protein RND81_10G062500 [Saponaria officinalis]|uniref:Myb/SANT-like DNA-binding domain-containing protein n=1 Tax=Saponaria officinalis TaxID=3572 RepID=A0AAW1HYA7_SAPOF
MSLTAMSAPPPMSAREDCWSEDATFTLIEAWGKRCVDLNRVVDTVNAHHGHIKKARRTDVQCKNRIDTLKKKYKIEKARKLPISASFSPPFGVPIHQHHQFGAGATMNPSNVATMRTPNLGEKRRAVSMSLTQSLAAQGEEYFRRNYAAVTAAAAREEEQSEDESKDEEDEEEEEAVGAEERNGDGIRKLARVIEKFGEVYARVERDKQRQLIELEKQRMQFATEMECHRMQMLVEMQVQLEKIKRAKRSSSDGQLFTTSFLAFIFALLLLDECTLMLL